MVPSSWYRGLVVVRGFSSERKVTLLSDLGRLLSRIPLAVDCLCAVMARDANVLMRRWRSPSFRTHLLFLLSAHPQRETKTDLTENVNSAVD